MEDSKRQEVVKHALGYLKTPYQHQGKAPGVGLDCVGIIECAYAAAGLVIPLHNNYGREPMGNFLKLTLEKYFKLTSSPKTADIMLIAYFGVPHHLAIYNDGRMIHSSSATEKVIEHRISAAWKRMTIGYYTWHKQ